MGFITKIVGGLFSFIGSLFGVFGKLLGFKKSEFYLELDEAGQGEAPAPQADPAPKSSEPVAPAAPAAESSAPQPTVVQPAPLPVGPTLASVMSNGSKSGGMTFATDYLVNPQLANLKRRRPGPSLASFKSMARDMKPNR